MDENTSPVSTPGSENSSPIHERFSPLQSKTNKSRYEFFSDGSKKNSTTSSPRSPLYEKNVSTVTPPVINRQSFQQQYRNASSPRQQKLQQLQQRTEWKGIIEDICVNDGLRQQQPQQQQQKQQLQQQQSTSPHPEQSNPKVDDKLQQEPVVDEEIKVLQQEMDALKATLKAERQHTTWMTTWEKTMVELINQYKELQVDMDDSVDILVESDQVLTELAAEEEKQAQVDRLMNLVPQRLFEIEELKSKLSAE